MNGIKDIIDRVIEEKKFMGTIVISKNNETLYEKACGYADISNKRMNNIDTKFQIASGAKLFTALGIGSF